VLENNPFFDTLAKFPVWFWFILFAKEVESWL